MEGCSVSEEVYTVEQFAERLKLHPKTVRRFIREGRVRAVKVGRSYRILRSDLEALTGPMPTETRSAARVTSIVDLADVNAERAQHLARVLPSLRMGREQQADAMNLDLAYDPARRSLKVVIVGSPADTAGVLQVLQAILDN
jgi:excisionase family DNA binding protein